jgi:hypothetical protein
LTTEKIKNLVKRFNNHIEKSKDHQAYSDFKEGVNKGLDIAKYTFEENADKFSLHDLDEGQAVKVKSLQNDFNKLLDGINVQKKPNCSEECLDGIHFGFERSKKVFGDFIQEAFPFEN